MLGTPTAHDWLGATTVPAVQVVVPGFGVMGLPGGVTTIEIERMV